MMSTSSKSCVVVTCFSENQPGYLDFSYRIHALAKQYNTTVLSQDPLDQSELLVPSVTYVSMGRQNGKYGWLRYLWKCAAYSRAHRPNVLILLHSSASPIALLAGNIPTCLYWNEHPTNLIHLLDGFHPVRNCLAYVLQRLVFWGARCADLIMPIGEEHYADLLLNGCKKEKLRLIYMGVDDSFSGASSIQADNTCPLQLIYIGSVSAQRGRDVMLEGMAQASRRGLNAHLTIVGATDEQLTYCNTRLPELGLRECVSVKGRVPGKDIPALLAKSDIGICLWEDKPWWRFNPPTKLFEYLVAGLPVLASDIRTHTRYVESWNNGLIFEYGAQGFADAVEELVSNREKIAGMKSSALASGQQYMWKKIEPEFIRLVKELATGSV